jgi:hypothetical protein
MNEPAASAGPWTKIQRSWLLTANFVGLALIIMAWNQASAITSVPVEQGWLKLAIAGFVIAGGADGIWILAGLRSVDRCSLALVLSQQGDRPVSESPGRNGHRAAPLVSGAKMSRYHRPNCLLMVGKAARGTSRAEHERAGLRPCEVCRP